MADEEYIPEFTEREAPLSIIGAVDGTLLNRMEYEGRDPWPMLKEKIKQDLADISVEELAVYLESFASSYRCHVLQDHTSPPRQIGATGRKS